MPADGLVGCFQTAEGCSELHVVPWLSLLLTVPFRFLLSLRVFLCRRSKTRFSNQMTTRQTPTTSDLHFDDLLIDRERAGDEVQLARTREHVVLADSSPCHSERRSTCHLATYSTRKVCVLPALPRHGAVLTHGGNCIFVVNHVHGNHRIRHCISAAATPNRRLTSL